MWNNSSRSRWLVNRVDSLRRRASTATHSASSLFSIPNFYSKKEKCHPLQATRQSSRRNAIINPTTTRARRSPNAETQRGAPSGVTACPNQIIVVLFNVLLANCVISSVAHTLGVTAAFGAPSPLDDVRFGVAPAPHYHNRHSHLREHETYLLDDNNNNYNNDNYNNDNDNNDNYNNNNNNEDNIDNNYVVDRKSAAIQLQRSQNFKISPKPCSIGRIEGTCMFVWECIKSEGRHVGMCVDSFMFGSCCSHNASDNIVLSETFSYTRPTKPVGISSVNHKPRPPHFPQRPNISGMTTIERPHGAGTLVIRPSGPHHQGVLFKPHHLPTKTRPSFSSTSTTTTIGKTTQVPTTTTNTMFSSPSMSIDMQSAASVPATNMWHTSPETTHQHHHHHHHWQLPTEPSFITKPRPPSWEKPTSMRPKPPKPSKKPIVSDHPSQQQQQQHQPPQAGSVQATGKPTPTTMRPKPQIFNTKPMKTTTSTMRPYFRPTAGWSSSASTSGTTSTSSSPSSSSSSSITTQRHTSTTQAPTSAQLPQLPQQHQQLLIITRPTTSPATATTSSTTAQTAISTVAMHQHQPDHQHHQQFNHHHHHHHHHQQQHHEQTPSTLNLSTMESNEIVESSSSNTKLATIKTITAARSECGIPVLQRPETRIVGGKSAPFGRWPWQVSVRRTSFFGFSSTHRCGGALINENWIATAGHCVDDLLISQIRIRVGEYDFSHVQEQLPYIERGVAKKVVHPKYNFFTYEYDLALVKLEQPLEFAPHVSPICLPQTDSLLIGMNATVTGWGRLSEGGTLPSVLQEVSVPIVSNDNCKTMFLRAGRQEFIPDIFLCAGYETGGQDSCQGDSGGPLQVKSQDGRFFLAGIISWGIGCAEANLPGVCTRISKFVPWIMDNVT